MRERHGHRGPVGRGGRDRLMAGSVTPGAADIGEANSVVHAFIGRHVDSGSGSAVAIRTPERSISYGDLRALVNRTGNALRALGLQPEQRVAMAVADGIEFAAIFFGAISIGAVAVPLSTRLTASEYRTVLRDSRAKAIVSEAAIAPILDEIRDDLPHLGATLVVGGDHAGWQRFEALVAAESSGLREEPMSLDDMAFWLYTSGTTGQPKAAVHARRTLFACRQYGVEVLGASKETRVLATSKLFFAYALSTALLIPLYVGGQTFLHPSWPDVSTTVATIREFQPTLFFSVPTFYARLLRADLPPDTFASVKLCVSAGECLPEEIYNSFERRFGVPILDGIGATEAIFIFISNRPDRRRPGSSGVEVPGTDARISSPDGAEVAPGEPGVLWVRSPSAALGYWNRVDLTRRVFNGDWYRTGDVFSKDVEGFYHHLGREDDYFKVAGLWVSPAALERAALQHPDVAGAGAIGTEDEQARVQPVLFVVAKDPGAVAPTFLTELDALIAANVAPHQRPRRIVLVPELPRTATGKLQRFKLQEIARAGA